MKLTTSTYLGQSYISLNLSIELKTFIFFKVPGKITLQANLQNLYAAQKEIKFISSSSINCNCDHLSLRISNRFIASLVLTEQKEGSKNEAVNNKKWQQNCY